MNPETEAKIIRFVTAAGNVKAKIQLSYLKGYTNVLLRQILTLLYEKRSQLGSPYDIMVNSKEHIFLIQLGEERVFTFKTSEDNKSVVIKRKSWDEMKAKLLQEMGLYSDVEIFNMPMDLSTLERRGNDDDEHIDLNHIESTCQACKLRVMR